MWKLQATGGSAVAGFVCPLGLQYGCGKLPTVPLLAGPSQELEEVALLMLAVGRALYVPADGTAASMDHLV